MKKNQLFFTLALMLVSLSLFAQTGIIRGSLLDKASGEPLMFANVFVAENPTTGTDTDLDGKFELSLAPGSYNIKASYVGYAEKTIEGVIVTANEVTVLDFFMEVEGFNALGEGEEIIVKAERIEKNETALLAVRKSALTIQDNLSAQEISRYGSANAAESMKQVTGASVVGGKYIYVRGLGDRYTSAQINGQVMPSTSPYRNSVQLDLIPANLLDNIIASKTFTADQPGNFTGGNINIKTKSFPERYTLSASISSTFNTQSSFNSDFRTHEGGASDYLGFDDGGRDLPAILQNDEDVSLLGTQLPNQAIQEFRNTGSTTSLDLLDSSVKSLNNNLTNTTMTSALDQSVSFSVGNQIQVGNNPLGFIVGVNYNKDYDVINGGINRSYDVISGLVQSRDLLQDRGSETATLGGLASLSYKFGKANKISFNTIYNHEGEKATTFLEGFNANILSNGFLQQDELAFTERELTSFQLNGEHVVTDKQIKVEWGGSYNLSSQLEPDLRLFSRTYNPQDDGTTSWNIDASEVSLPTHFFRELYDNQYAGKVDFTIPFAQTKNKGNKIKVGANYTKKNRDFSEIRFQYQNSLNSAINGIRPFEGDAADYFANDNLGVVGFNEAINAQIFGLYLTEDTRAENSYTGFEEVAAAYAMVNYDLDFVKIIAGLRYEATSMETVSGDINKAPGTIQENDILPSLNIIVPLNDKSNLRASATQTLARPNLREISPFSAYNINDGFFYTGNPDLTRSLIQNYDLRWETFPRAGEVIALSAYYKNFDNPIVKAFVPENANNNEIQWINVENATVYGLEAEYRKKLDFIHSSLDKFKFSMNASYIHSEVAIPDAEHEQILTNNPEKGLTRPFEGQSPFLINAGLLYTDLEKGLDAVLSYNIFGDRLFIQSPFARPDVYQSSMPQLDLSVRKSINEKLNIKVSARNLLNSNFKTVLNYGGEEFIFQEYKRGVSFGLGLSYKI